MPEPASQPTGSTVRPLWVIAISLATIAICLVLLVIKQQVDNPLAKPVAKVDESNRLAVRGDSLPDRVFPKRAFDTTRRPPENPTAPELVPVEVPVPVSALPAPTFPTERPGGGVIAPVIAEATPNTMTAISGRVTLRGTPPAEAQFFVVDDPSAKPQDPARQTRNFRVTSDGGLADVFVSIKDFSKRKSFKPPTARYLISFAQGQIQPFANAAMIDQKFLIRNADNHAHRLTIARPGLSPFLDIPLSPRKDAQINETFRISNEILHLQCKLHAWETGHLLLVDHPFFSVTDTNGNFVIANVPPGKYTLNVSHPMIQGTNSLTRNVVVNANEITQVSLTLDAPKEKRSSDRIQARASNP